MSQQHLKKSLSPILLWGLGVGYVISGMYFGWNLGLDKGGTWGLAIATFFVLVMYFAFSLCYSELACAIPKAGGAYDYAGLALGEKIGLITGIAQWVEFVFAPPAIAMGIGAYFNLFFPEIKAEWFALVVYLLFTLINVRGVKLTATFELIITCIAVLELLIFAGITLPHFNAEAFSKNPFPKGIEGIFAAIPFAIWFFLGIEGLANVAEETIHPQRNITRGFVSSMLTLSILCILTFVSAAGVGGWEKIVYKVDGSTSDSPLPMALQQVTGAGNWLYHMLVSIGIFGFIASFNGLLLAAGRATFELGRTGHFPIILKTVHKNYQTPWVALMVNMMVGIIAVFTGKTGDIITISVFGALLLYFISSITHIILRKKEPTLNRPFITPFYPFLPIISAFISFVCLLSMVYYNSFLFIIFLILLVVLYVLSEVLRRT